MPSNFEQLGDLLYNYGLNQFEVYGLDKKFSTSEEVFQRFVAGLFDGMINTNVLERIKPEIFNHLDERKAVDLCGKLTPLQFREEIIKLFHSVRLGGLFNWNRMADGILQITNLSKQFGGLSNLYSNFLSEEESPKAARHKILVSIIGIPGISDKKALVLLRDLHYQCDWDYPIEDLPMPVDTHIRVVLKRMGYVSGVKERQTNIEIQSAARTYFKVPIVVDLAVWAIGTKFCPKSGVLKCKQGCPAAQFCKYAKESIQ